MIRISSAVTHLHQEVALKCSLAEKNRNLAEINTGLRTRSKLREGFQTVAILKRI